MKNSVRIVDFFGLKYLAHLENLGEKTRIALPFIFYRSIKFVFETVFISEQITENSSGALLEISEKCITKLNVFSYLILQFRLKKVWKLS